MVLNTARRSSIYNKLVPVLGEEDALALMDAFPASEADELVTKQFLRAELADLRGDLRIEMHRLAMRQMGLLGGATALLATLGFFT